ncbi:hypothetical protein ABZX40_17955 [Streptomyces sp. NPDC004610]|uniref:hypothetical protein n=1 Tax=unclassified Streptomyces TaxID=2593676 RepID=UPI0033B20034
MTGPNTLPDDVTEAELAEAVQALRRARGHRTPEATVHIRGEGGAVFEMDPARMSDDMKRRLRLGYLREVSADGTPLRDRAAPVPPAAAAGQEPVARPPKSAPKADWVLYAVRELGLAPERAEAMTRRELIDLPADHAEHPGPAPGDQSDGAPSGDGRPSDDAPKAEWIAHVVRRGLASVEDAATLTKDDLIDLAS